MGAIVPWKPWAGRFRAVSSGSKREGGDAVAEAETPARTFRRRCSGHASHGAPPASFGHSARLPGPGSTCDLPAVAEPTCRMPTSDRRSFLHARGTRRRIAAFVLALAGAAALVPA